MDRRPIHERIGQLKSELEDVKRHREVTRKQRDRKYTLSAAIVGCTNAGKSTLLNTRRVQESWHRINCLRRWIDDAWIKAGERAGDPADRYGRISSANCRTI